ncbi:outer-membrane lipoprotein carrier protein [Marinibactrum halimedae]|uniref:Outer-membrane lipoprotein carrier protein n=2 Tax=Marinibactrum halimedae TaxID=1444977 RepID=A0AA37TCR7_9GAMM|nr:outer-membrane lipoprotein carrier protein [Marinibactrum halimedae]
MDEFIQGRFQQEKHLKGFSFPIQTEGTFAYLKEKGVLWQAQKPFVRSVTYLADQTLTWKPDGTLESAQKPDMMERRISEIIMALLSGNRSILEKQFTIEETKQENQWQLILQPSQIVVKKVLSEIHLSGRDFVQHIKVVSASGDQTIIKFDQLTHHDNLPGDYCAYFSSSPALPCAMSSH